MADSATNIISRLATRFDNAVKDREKPDFLTRDIGGHWRLNHPYVSGYFQVMFGLPEELFGSSERAGNASQWLHSACESFQSHSEAVTSVDIMGQGQIGSSFAVNRTTTREFTLAFREYQHMPILNIIRRWAAVFDPYTGVSPLDGNRFLPVNYKGWCAVIQTKPTRSANQDITADDIEECYIYQGVFPTAVPTDTAAAEDIATNDTVQLSVQFKFDGHPLTSAEPGVTDKCVELLSSLRYMGQGGIDNNSTYNRYYTHGVSNLTTQFGSHQSQVTSASDPDKGASPERTTI